MTASSMSAAELGAEIDHTRAELEETVAALAAKADVKARLAETADSVKQMVLRNPIPWLLGAATVLIALISLRSRRR